MTGRDWATRFNEAFAAPASAVRPRIWGEVYGDEYPATLATYNAVSLSELNRFVVELRLSPGDVLVDVGCGRGGPGLWVAAQAGSRLIGIDIAETAVNVARDRAMALDLADRAEFRRGSFQDTGLAGVNRSVGLNRCQTIDRFLRRRDSRSGHMMKRARGGKGKRALVNCC